MIYRQYQILRIGQSTIRLQIQSDRPDTQLNDWYQDFTAEPDADEDFELNVIHEYQVIAARDPFPRTTFQGDVVLCQSTGFEGKIYQEAKNAILHLQCQEPYQDIDYFLRVITALLVFRRGGFLLHCAGIEWDGKGYVFLGHSGSGKTTVSRLSTHAKVLNDDLICVFPDADGWTISGTPFTNPTQVQPLNRSTLLHRLFVLVQDKETKLVPMTKSQATAALLANVPIIPISPQLTPELLTRISRAIDQHQPMYLHFLPDSSFWDLILSQDIDPT